MSAWSNSWWCSLDTIVCTDQKMHSDLQKGGLVSFPPSLTGFIVFGFVYQYFCQCYLQFTCHENSNYTIIPFKFYQLSDYFQTKFWGNWIGSYAWLFNQFTMYVLLPTADLDPTKWIIVLLFVRVIQKVFSKMSWHN